MIKFNDLPVEIQERMLDEQVRQGNPRNAEVFEADTSACGDEGGFSWSRTVEGCTFWAEIILRGNFAEFYKKYPKQKL